MNFSELPRWFDLPSHKAINFENHIPWNRWAPILVVLGHAFKFSNDPFSRDSKLVQSSLFSTALCERGFVSLDRKVIGCSPCPVCFHDLSEAQRFANCSHLRALQLSHHWGGEFTKTARNTHPELSLSSVLLWLFCD